jgi:hypothetical protein
VRLGSVQLRTVEGDQMLQQRLLRRPDIVRKAAPKPAPGTGAGRIGVFEHGCNDAEDLSPQGVYVRATRVTVLFGKPFRTRTVRGDWGRPVHPDVFGVEVGIGVEKIVGIPPEIIRHADTSTFGCASL